MTSGIYTIRCKVTGKVYVGASCNIYRRWKEHRKMLKDGVHHSKKLQQAWNDYGVQSFEFCIVEEVVDRVLSAVERKYIDRLNSESDGYNASDNSVQALREAVAARKKDAKQVHITLSPDAIARLDTLAEQLGVKSRSELIERLSEIPSEKLTVLLCVSDPTEFRIVHKSRLPKS